MSKKASRKSVIGRACNAMMESLEKRVLFTALPNPPVPPFPVLTGTVPLQGVVGTPISISPAMMRTRYNMDNVYFQLSPNDPVVTADGAGQTIAIVDPYGSPTIVNDVETFDQHWGISNVTPDFNASGVQDGSSFFLTTVTLPTTVNTEVDSPTIIAQASVETSLDVEWAHVMAPEAHILLVVAPSESFLDMLESDTYALGTVGDASLLPSGDVDLFPAASGQAVSEVVPGISPFGPSVISNSWGLELNDPRLPADLARFDGFLATPSGHQGVTVFFASGDKGDLTYPSESDQTIAVGGTTNNLNLDGTLNTIGTWAGSGGGVQNLYTPAYQVPMVSMDADPLTGAWVYDSDPSISSVVGTPPAPLPPTPISPGWFVLGGTSLATPMMAGYFSTIQQGLTVEGLPTLTTQETFTDLAVAGEANDTYFSDPVFRGTTFNEFTTYPLWGKGANVTVPDLTKIPVNGNAGFGDPVTSGADRLQSGVTPGSAIQATDGLTDLFLSEDADSGTSPVDYIGSFSYLEAVPALSLQTLGKPGTNSYFPAPSSHIVLDAVTENNNVMAGNGSPVDAAEFVTTGHPVTDGIAGQAISGTGGGFVVDVDFDGIANLPDSGYNGIVTLSLSSNAIQVSTNGGSPAVLAFDPTSENFNSSDGTVSVVAVLGVATFSDVIIDSAGSGYILLASATGVVPGSSAPFNVQAAAVSQMLITTEPVSTFQFASVPVMVTLEDAFGNVITADDYSTVNLSVNSGPEPFSVPVSAMTVDGVASFDLSFGFVGTYSLLASDVFEGFPPVVSSIFVISSVATQTRGLNGTIISTPGLNAQQERNGPVLAGG